MRRQHGALRHGHDAVAVFGLIAQPHFAFAGNVYRQPCARTVAPGVAVNRRQIHGRLHFADALQLLFKHALFICHLRGKICVLQGAAAAFAIMRAGSLHTEWRRFDNGFRVRQCERSLFLRDADAHRFQRQRALHEHGFAADPRHAARFVI